MPIRRCANGIVEARVMLFESEKKSKVNAAWGLVIAISGASHLTRKPNKVVGISMYEIILTKRAYVVRLFIKFLYVKNE
jgi:hypothetical protein